MIKHKWIGAITALLMAVAVLATVFVCLNPSAVTSITGSSQSPYVSAMDKTKIMSIQIIAEEAEWASMLENATAEEYIQATVIINGVSVENVGIRPKGNSSLSTVARDDTTDRFSFKIEFDHYITGQTWLGLDKIVINNMQGDATYMKEYISYDIMSYIGVETPLYAFADISLNGETWGFYLAVECLEDSYTERVYGDDHGKLYKPESMGMRGEGQMNEFMEGMQGNNTTVQPQDGQEENGQIQPPDGNTQNFPNIQDGDIPGGFGGGFGGMSGGGGSLQYTDDEVSGYSAIFDNSVFEATDTDYKRVIDALKKLSNGEDLEDTVDVEATLKYFTAHTVVVNLDSYVSSMAHNYYLYEDDGQLTILPWDYNLAFGGFQSGDASSVVNFPIDTPVSGVSLEERPLLGKLLEVPEYLELYHEYLQQIVDEYFNSGLFEQKVDSLNILISSYVEKDPTAFYDYDAYQTAVVELKELGLLRAESVEGQLDGVIPSTSEGQSADSSKLVDASGVDLSALGSMGNGMGSMEGGMNGGMNGGMDFNRETMQKAMEIIQAAGENELTGEQLEQLRELGLTEEQITQFQSMSQRGFSGNMDRPQGGMGGRFPGDIQGGNINEANQNSDSGNGQSVITAGFDITTWLFIGGCLVLLLSGLVFVVLFKRRSA